MLIMLCMSLLFMCVKQKCNFYFQKYDILLIFYRFLCESFMIFHDFFAIQIRIRTIDTDPEGQNNADT